MKTAYKYIIAGLAVTLALASCTKDVIAEKEDVNPQDGGLRTIAVSFGASTKTSMGNDGITPVFTGEGEEVIVSNGSGYQKLAVEIKDGIPSITTNLSGELTAVYPSKAAKLEGTKITGILIPSNQTGRFADANIAMATIAEGGNKAVFQNQTAVLKFYVDRSIGVTALAIKARPDGAPISDGYIDEQGVKDEVKSQEKDFNTFSVTVMPETDDENWTLADQTDDPEQRVCYVAIRSDGATLNMGVTSRTKTQLYEDENIEQTGRLQYQQKGIVSRLFENVSLKPGDLANVFIPYYIPVKVSDEPETYQYWAYCNIGAFLPEEAGYYFSWGNTQGYVNTGIKWVEAPRKEEDVALDGGFCGGNYEKTYGAKLMSNLKVDANEDAACAAWGGKWRMPSAEECKVLTKFANGWNDELKGCCFAEFIFLPAAGYGGSYESDRVAQLGEKGNYWSSTIVDGYVGNAYFLSFDKESSGSIPGQGRYEGRPIRPIFGDPAQEQVALEIKKYVEGPTL